MTHREVGLLLVYNTVCICFLFAFQPLKDSLKSVLQTSHGELYFLRQKSSSSFKVLGKLSFVSEF